MRSVSMRRAVPAGVAAAAALALSLSGVASASKPPPWHTDDLGQCEGKSLIEAVGSTFQAPAEFYWTGVNTEKSNEETKTGFNVSSNKAACSGSQGSGAKPEVRYIQANSLSKGSGACLKTFGEGITTFGEIKSGETYPRVAKYPFCGTDEAPKESVKIQMEGFATSESGFASGKGEAIESIPVAQGAEAMIVHLPSDCTAQSEITTGAGKVEKLNRLALTRATIAGIYEGNIRTWKQAVEAQGGPTGEGKNKLTCTAGGENDRIKAVVRSDKSGTTHIFKAFLLQVNPSTTPTMEDFHSVDNEGTIEHPCSGKGKEENPVAETWETVSEGCENQRWPIKTEAETGEPGVTFAVTRAKTSGNPGVIKEVHEEESSIGYADLAAVAEKEWFTKKGEGGENSSKEHNKQFWAVVQNSAEGASPETFEEPSTKGDKAKEGESNCAGSKYVSEKGKIFPPKSTRYDWSKVKAEPVSKNYSICGVTYVLAARQYYYFLKPYFPTDTTEQLEEESKKIATAVKDYLLFVVNTKGGGGAKTLKGHDYEGLTKEVAEIATKGVEEIGSKVSEEGKVEKK